MRITARSFSRYRSGACLLFSLIVMLSAGLTVFAQGEVDGPDTLPLLPEQRHIGSMFYGWGAPPPPVIQPRIDEATAAGMNAFTVYLDWPQLEPHPGNYDLTELRDTLSWATANRLSTFANITVVDIEMLVLPPEFTAEGNSTEFASEYSFTSPQIIDRFLNMLDEVVPLMVENGVFYLGVGNEVDGWLTENPNQLEDYLTFIETVRTHVRTLEPDLAVGVTVTGNVPLFNPGYLQNFYAVADIVSSNIYGIDITDFTATDYESTAELLESFIAAFDGRPIVIPELGCNSAASMQSDLMTQRECFSALFDVLAAHPNVRFVTVFTFHDFEAPVCEAIQAAFGYDADAEFESIFDERVADYLCSLGVVNADGSPKPAFEAFLDGVQRLTAP